MGEGSKRIKRSSKKRQKNGNGQEGFFAVGLGASAGGIRALEQFFEGMPPDTGMAFVVVLHLSPEHESNLAEMLQRRTMMEVTQVNEAVHVEPNHVYVIPPAKHMVMVDGLIHLAEPDKEAGRRVPIDLLFRTLGAAYREHAIGIVLSGTGTDGTLGLRRIKEEGGISIAQEPNEAEYDGMPRSAIREGLVDFILPVAAMPEKIIGIREASEKIRLPPEGSRPPRGEELSALRDILSMLRVRTGHDFSNYKQTTLLRRITRRMQMHEVPTLAGYRQYLREHPSEIPDLMQDLLISVTNFFRDSSAFDFLASEAVPDLFKDKGETDQVRVWVTGCATGEEAYSLAILLAEHAARIDHPPQIQVFATDLDEEAIANAREGVFPETIAADVTPERLQQFFTHEGRHYYVRKHVREMVLFAPHNILRDPPFSRIDMVSCRNLLIYLNSETQDRVLEIFHFALRPGGFLFLGSAESADNLPDLFKPVDKKLRVYRRTAIASALQNIPPMASVGKWEPRPLTEPAAGLKSYRFAELHRTLLEHYAPPSVLVNEMHDIVHVSDNAGRYLRIAGGEPSNNLLALVHPDLRLDVRAALYSAAQEETGEIITRFVPVQFNGETHQVRVKVRRITRPDLHATYLLVTFDEAPEAQPAEQPGSAQVEQGVEEDARSRVVERLEEELQQTRNVLRATVEQYETTNEELRASNEELQALNEELRSATEELETSKEELQSLNEELHTVNHELKDKVDELGRSNTDLANLLASTDIGTIFLDHDLNITRYTPNIIDLFNVIPQDVGRPFAHLTHRLDYNELPQDAARVLRKLQPVEREVRSPEGIWYAARILPYRTQDDRIAGVVITFMDITTRKLIEERAQYVHEQLSLATDAAEAGWGGWNMKTGATEWDERAKNIIGFADASEATTIEGWLKRLHTQDRPLVEAHINECLERDKDFDLEYRVVRADGKERVISAKGRFQKAADGTPLRQTGLVVDISERSRTEDVLRESEERMRRAFEVETIGIIFFHTSGGISYANEAFLQMSGYTREDLEAGLVRWDTMTPPEWMPISLQAVEEFRATGRTPTYEKEYIRKDGSRWWALFAGTGIGEEEGVEYVLDITEYKRTLARLNESEERQSLILESATDFAIITLDSERRITRWSAGAEQIFGYSEQEVLGQSGDIIFTPEDRERGAPLAEQQQADAEGRAADERWHLRRDGSRFYMSGVMTPLRTGGASSGYVKIGRDLTREKQTEERLAELIDLQEAERSRLEEHVGERTRELVLEVTERRDAEERVKDLLRRVVHAQELERSRISRDLHDQLGQQLTALRLNLQSLSERCCDEDEELSELVVQAQSVAERLDSEVDFLAWELRPAALDEAGLVAALENFVQEWSKHFKIEANYHTARLGNIRLTPEAETSLYRIAQEALNNVYKHAEASRVDVLLERRDHHAVLIIEDDGRGFDTSAALDGERGMGLLNMRERAALIGGALEIESASNEGTTIFTRIPIQQNEKKGGGFEENV